MSMSHDPGLLVVGEIFVDVTLSSSQRESKMRLGGIVHAARGLWASGIPYSLAAICPGYLVEDAKAYALAHGCAAFIWLGEVLGAPNIVVIGDERETSFQGYEDILRDRRRASFRDVESAIAAYQNVLVFPGRFDLASLAPTFSPTASFDFDVAYDVADIACLAPYAERLRTLIISTSSQLFMREGHAEVSRLVAGFQQTRAKWLLLKENRGGSRLFSLDSEQVEHIPAQLGETVNSVGVGDVYSAVLSGTTPLYGVIEAAWRGSQAATRYAQTTFPDDFRRDVQRDFAVRLQRLKSLWGTSLPWHERPKHSIYLAAPDFSYESTPELDRAIEAVEYHNFRLRRPLKEIGELRLDATFAERRVAYAKDVELLRECSLVLAVPLGRDPGTLVEIGWALAMAKPVIVFDPRLENNNTMVVAGAAAYSNDFDVCLGALFQTLSQPCP